MKKQSEKNQADVSRRGRNALDKSLVQECVKMMEPIFNG
jgi:hypothetical protein